MTHIFQAMDHGHSGATKVAQAAPDPARFSSLADVVQLSAHHVLRLVQESPPVASAHPHRHIHSGTRLTDPCHICAGAELGQATSEPGLGSPLATSAPGLGSPATHLRRDFAHPPTSAAGLSRTFASALTVEITHGNKPVPAAFKASMSASAPVVDRCLLSSQRSDRHASAR